MSPDWGERLADPAIGVLLRPIAESDLPFLERLFISTREAEFAILPWTEEQRRDFLAQQFRAQHQHYLQHYPKAEFLLIELQGEPIGRIYVELGRDELRLMEISLLPEFRGRGRGGAMLERLCAEADRLACAVGLHVEAHNPAVRLYRRLGFDKVETRGIYDYMLRPAASGRDSRQENTAS